VRPIVMLLGVSCRRRQRTLAPPLKPRADLPVWVSDLALVAV
jgi:hypothetical protein